MTWEQDTDDGSEDNVIVLPETDRCIYGDYLKMVFRIRHSVQGSTTQHIYYIELEKTKLILNRLV